MKSFKVNSMMMPEMRMFSMCMFRRAKIGHFLSETV